MTLLKDLGYKPNSYGTLTHYGIYKCPSCGNDWEVSVQRVKNGKATQCKSCGMSTHKSSGHPLYPVWKGMMRRCYVPTAKEYKNYGAKGVIVCRKWREDVNVFIAWGEANGYKKGLHLDKDELSYDGKLYSPATCQFIAQAENNKMMKSNKLSKAGYTGVIEITKGKTWEARLSHNSKIVTIGYFGSAVEAAKARNKYITDNKLRNLLSKV